MKRFTQSASAASAASMDSVERETKIVDERIEQTLQDFALMPGIEDCGSNIDAVLAQNLAQVETKCAASRQAREAVIAGQNPRRPQHGQNFSAYLAQKLAEAEADYAPSSTTQKPSSPTSSPRNRSRTRSVSRSRATQTVTKRSNPKRTTRSSFTSRSSRNSKATFQGGLHCSLPSSTVRIRCSRCVSGYPA